MQGIRLVDRDLESRELVSPALVRSLIKDTVERRLALPERTLRPLAKHLGLTLVGTRGNSSVETGRLDTVLNPVDHGLHVVLGVGARLQGVGATVGSTGDQVQLVPLLHLGHGLGVRQAGVHDVLDGLPVVHGGCGGDTGVGFSVVVQELAAGLLEGGQVGQSGLERVHVAVEGGGHPLNNGVVVDAVQGGEVVELNQLDELGDELAAHGADVQLPGLGVVVVGGGGVVQRRTDLPGEVGALTGVIVETVVDGLGDGNIPGVNGAVLGGGCAGGAALSTLAEAEAKGGAGLGSAVVALADDGGEVEVEHAEVSTADDTVGTSIKGITGGNGGVDDLVQGTGGGVVVLDELNHVGEDVVHLLLGVAESGSSGNGTVVLVAVALDLAHTLTTTVGAALVVSVELGVGGGTVEALGEVLTDLSQFTQSLVREHVGGIPVNGAIAVQDNVVVGGSVQSAVAGAGGTTNSTVLETTGRVAVQRVTTATSNVETLLVVGRGRKGVLDDDLVGLTGVNVGQGHVTVVVGAALDGVGSGEGWQDVDAQDCAIGGNSRSHVGDSAQIRERGGRGGGSKSRSRGTLLETHLESSGKEWIYSPKECKKRVN